MEIILIRHGEPDYANDTLTSRGHKEAKKLAKISFKNTYRSYLPKS